jgi:hypothetical protein
VAKQSPMRWGGGQCSTRGEIKATKDVFTAKSSEQENKFENYQVEKNKMVPSMLENISWHSANVHIGFCIADAFSRGFLNF